MATTSLLAQSNIGRLNLLEETRFEKLPVTVYRDQHVASKIVAQRISNLIRQKQKAGN